MAQRVEMVFIDDLDGTEGKNGEIETVKFTFWGDEFEIDLNKKNRAAFEKAVMPFMEKARLVKHTRRSPKKSTSSKIDTKAIRAWARGAGIEVPDRGRIPNTVIEQYEAAH